MFAALQNIADVRLNERFTTRGPNCGFHPRALAEPRMMPRSKLPAMQIRSGYAILFDSCADFAQKRLNIYSGSNKLCVYPDGHANFEHCVYILYFCIRQGDTPCCPIPFVRCYYIPSGPPPMKHDITACRTTELGGICPIPFIGVGNTDGEVIPATGIEAINIIQSFRGFPIAFEFLLSNGCIS
jgi:hypothetical protein